MAKKRQACIVGYCGKTTIIDGSFVLYMIDTVGMPFDLVLEELKNRGWRFDVKGFINAALASKNYTEERLKVLFSNNLPKEKWRNL